MKVKFDGKGLNLKECEDLTPDKVYEVYNIRNNLGSLRNDTGAKITIMLKAPCAHLDWCGGSWEIVEE